MPQISCRHIVDVVTRRVFSTSSLFSSTTSSSASYPLIRSVLYVPASNSRALTKLDSILNSGKAEERPDAIMYDLEDGVMPDKKNEARIALYEYLMHMRDVDKETSSVTKNINKGLNLLRINRYDTP